MADENARMLGDPNDSDQEMQPTNENLENTLQEPMLTNDQFGLNDERAANGADSSSHEVFQSDAATLLSPSGQQASHVKTASALAMKSLGAMYTGSQKPCAVEEATPLHVTGSPDHLGTFAVTLYSGSMKPWSKIKEVSPLSMSKPKRGAMDTVSQQTLAVEVSSPSKLASTEALQPYYLMAGLTKAPSPLVESKGELPVAGSQKPLAIETALPGELPVAGMQQSSPSNIELASCEEMAAGTQMPPSALERSPTITWVLHEILLPEKIICGNMYARLAIENNSPLRFSVPPSEAMATVSQEASPSILAGPTTTVLISDDDASVSSVEMALNHDDKDSQMDEVDVLSAGSPMASPMASPVPSPLNVLKPRRERSFSAPPAFCAMSFSEDEISPAEKGESSSESSEFFDQDSDDEVNETIVAPPITAADAIIVISDSSSDDEMLDSEDDDDKSTDDDDDEDDDMDEDDDDDDDEDEDGDDEGESSSVYTDEEENRQVGRASDNARWDQNTFQQPSASQVAPQFNLVQSQPQSQSNSPYMISYGGNETQPETHFDLFLPGVWVPNVDTKYYLTLKMGYAPFFRPNHLITVEDGYRCKIFTGDMMHTNYNSMPGDDVYFEQEVGAFRATSELMQDFGKYLGQVQVSPTYVADDNDVFYEQVAQEEESEVSKFSDESNVDEEYTLAAARNRKRRKESPTTTTTSDEYESHLDKANKRLKED